MSQPLQYLESDAREPHISRGRQLLREHPEVRELIGPTRWTAFWVVALVAGQIGLAALMAEQPWWAKLLVAWFVGAFLTHGLWVLIHEATHNLVFKRPRDNTLLQLLANLPIVFPAAIGFRKFHLLHHRYQGDPELDADLASDWEAKLIGNTFFGKAFWLFNFWLFQALRVSRFKKVQLWDGWYIANWAVQIAFCAAIVLTLGWGGLLYLFLASIFAIGLHPLGARWIQEHFTVAAPQETYSYYGPLNLVAFNVGFHNEHHDLMRVPWTRLRKVRDIAPELYEPLHSHRSWTALWLKFLFDPKLSLYSRVIRHGTGPATLRVEPPVPHSEDQEAPTGSGSGAPVVATDAPGAERS